MLFRIAFYYLRSEWLKIAIVVFAVFLYAFLMVNNTMTMPMSYETFVAQYDSYTYSEEYTIDVLSKRMRIPREELGNSLEDAYPVIREKHFTTFVGYTSGLTFYFTPVLSGTMAVVILCTLFHKRRLEPLLASGCPRWGIYLFLSVLYFGFFLLTWLIAVPLCLSQYGNVPLTTGQYACLRLIKPTILIALLFGAAVSFFFAFLLRRPIFVFLVSVGLLFLIGWISGLVPIPVEFITALVEWDTNTGTKPLLAQCCVTTVVTIVAVIGGWLSFRRQEQL